MLRDSAHIQEFEAEWRNRKAQRSGGEEYQPLYTMQDAEAALAGARDIIAEQVSDDARLRSELRRFYGAFGVVKSEAAKEEDSVYA